MRNNKHIIILVAVLLLLASSLPGRPYIGISQGLEATTIDIGMLNRSFEQQLFLSLPTVSTNPSSYFETAGVGTVILARTRRFSPVVVGLGIRSIMVWEQGKGTAVGLGFASTLSYEFIANRGVLFLEGSYTPWKTEIGSPTSPLVDKQVGQYLRFGYHHIL